MKGGGVFTPTRGGWCEAHSWEPRYHRARARWEGPITRSGGNLYCGACKRRYEREHA